MNNSSKNPQAFKIILLLIGGITAVFLCLGTGIAGFALGRLTSSQESITETVTETVEVEVTREVPFLVEPSEPASPATEFPPPSPTAVIIDDPSHESDAGMEDWVTDDFSVFHEVWDTVEREYDGEILTDQEKLYSAIEGSLDALGDEFTTFIRPELAARLREDMGGSVSGIGAIVRENEEGFFEIVTPIEGQPADLIGLIRGDIVLAVDGQTILGMNFNEVILLVRGPSGSQVNLTIQREGERESLEFSIIRATYEVPVIDSELLPEGIAYVHLLEFSQGADEKLQSTLEELLAQNPRGLILDLRNNPGGFLDQSISVADIFLPQSVVLYERNQQGLDQTFSADDGDLAETIPLVVLVNEASASASEIVAGAVQDNGRGTIIGAITFGKGTVQTVHTLSDGSELRVTIARWYTPNDTSIAEEGITPDIEVESPLEIGGADDGQLERAVEYILTGQ